MKKILTSFILLSIFFLTPLSTFAFDNNKVNKILNTFYIKLDHKYTDANIKIEKIKGILLNIKEIKNTNWDNINTDSQKLVLFLEKKLQQKIIYYQQEQKETISIHDILNEKILVIDSRYINSEKNNHYSYSASEIKKGSKIKFGEFEILANGEFLVTTEFMEYKYGYPEVDLDNLYIEDEYGNRIFYNSEFASLGFTKQEFQNVIGNTKYTLYGISKEHYGNDDSFWVSLSEVNGKRIGRVLGVIKYESK